MTVEDVFMTSYNVVDERVRNGNANIVLVKDGQPVNVPLNETQTNLLVSAVTATALAKYYDKFSPETVSEFLNSATIYAYLDSNNELSGILTTLGNETFTTFIKGSYPEYEIPVYYGSNDDDMKYILTFIVNLEEGWFDIRE